MGTAFYDLGRCLPHAMDTPCIVCEEICPTSPKAIWAVEEWITPGSPRVIGISGPTGVGKSRLCFEFSEWCRERQIRVLEARAQVHSRSTPLVPVLEALRAFFRIEPEMTAEVARTRIEPTLTMLALPVADHLWK